MRIVLLDDYNNRIGGGQIGAVTTTFGHLALRNGWKIIEVHDEEDTPGRLQSDSR